MYTSIYNTDKTTLEKHTGSKLRCVDDGLVVAQRFSKILTTLKLVKDANIHFVDGGDIVNTPAIAEHWKIIDLPDDLQPPASLRT